MLLKRNGTPFSSSRTSMTGRAASNGNAAAASPSAFLAALSYRLMWKRGGRAVLCALFVSASVFFWVHNVQLRQLSSLTASSGTSAFVPALNRSPAGLDRGMREPLGYRTVPLGHLRGSPDPTQPAMLRPYPPMVSAERFDPRKQALGRFRGGKMPYPSRLGTKSAPPSSQSTSMAEYHADAQLQHFRREHRCWREPCKFLFPGVLGEQLTKASLHFYQLALLARQLNRTLVLPNVADSRIESCLLYPFTTYFDVGALDGVVEWIEITEFVEILRDKFRKRPYSPGDLRKRQRQAVFDLAESNVSRWITETEEVNEAAAAKIPGTPSYNLRHSLTNPSWITAQYLVFSVQPLPAETDRRHPRGLKELLKCYRENMNNPTGAPSNPLPFTRRMLNFVPPENRLAGETDDTRRFSVRVPRHADEAEIWDAYARSVFATLESLADVDVFGVHYTWRKPYLFPEVALTPLNYNPLLWARARRIVSTYVKRPFVAVHWRMETIDPRGMPACADTLVQHLSKLKRELLDARRSGPFVNTLDVEFDDITVFLANDLPPNEGEVIRHRSTTFVNASPLCYAARQRLLDAESRLTTWWALTVEDRRRAAEEGREVPDELPGEARWDTGITGILDKLVCSLADRFVAGPPGCSKGSSFTDQIASLRGGPSTWTPRDIAGAQVDVKTPPRIAGGDRQHGADGQPTAGAGHWLAPRIFGNFVDTWPGPSVGHVQRVAAQYNFDVTTDLNNSAEWLGR